MADLMLGVVTESFDHADQDLTDVWSVKCAEAYRRYSENPTPEKREEWRKALRTFADLVIRGQPPAE